MARVVVFGDAMLDVDIDTRSDRVAPDSGAPVLDEIRRATRPGGAALAATFASAGAQTTLVTAIGHDVSGTALRSAIGTGVNVYELHAPGATTVKTRLRRGEHTVARLDQGGSGTEILDRTTDSEQLAELVRTADAVLVSDYGRGVVRSSAVQRALQATRTVVWDPHPRGARPSPGCTIVTPSEAEAAAAVGAPRAADLRQACRHARLLVDMWGARNVAITRGENGAVLASGSASAAAFSAPRRVDGDPCGAGDRFAAAVTVALADGALPSEAVAAAVDSATSFVAGGGVAALSDDHIARPAPRAGADGGDVRQPVLVATGGCFDLLHAGHVATLEAARALGDRLVVCVNSDESVRRLKGAGRPVQPVEDRVRVLRSLRAVDDVVVFAEDTPLGAIKRLHPDIWVKGGDYAGVDMPESRIVSSWGGEIVTVPYLAGRSTTSILVRRSQ